MRHTGHAPFGFEWKGDRLCVVEEEARTRRIAFELYAELRNKAAVAKRLNDLGCRTRRRGLWRDVTISRLLSCSSARGIYAVSKTALSDSGQRMEKPEDEWNFVECPPIVSEELWERVQGILTNEASPNRGGATSLHPFSGILFCQCGARMNPASSSPKYVCAECGNRIPIGDLENAFLDQVTDYLRTRSKAVSDIISVAPELATERELFESTQNKARHIEEEISKAERLYMDNRVSVERFEKLHRPLEDERRAIQRKLGVIKAKLARLEAKHPPNQDEHPLKPALIQKRWPQMPPQMRREIVRTFVRGIVVREDEIEFSYLVRDSSERTTKRQHYSHPTNSASAAEEPLYIRLPKPGERCPRTGMTRSALNELILPTERNSYNPPVESKCLRKREGGKGTRLIVWESLKGYLDKHV